MLLSCEQCNERLLLVKTRTHHAGIEFLVFQWCSTFVTYTSSDTCMIYYCSNSILGFSFVIYYTLIQFSILFCRHHSILYYHTITTSSYKSKYRMDSIERDYYELSNMMAMLIATYVFWCQQIAWLLNKSTRIVSTKPHKVTHVIGCRLDSKIWFGLYLL